MKVQSWIPILLVFCTSFNYGCTATQRKELVAEAIEGAKDYFLNTALPQIQDQTAKMIEDKVSGKEKAQLEALDSELQKFPKFDEDGNITILTWRDFDKDKSGHLEEGEVLAVGKFITSETVKQASKGEMTMDEATRTAKTAGVTLAGLLAIALAMRGAKKLRGKKKQDPPGMAVPPSGDPA